MPDAGLARCHERPRPAHPLALALLQPPPRPLQTFSVRTLPILALIVIGVLAAWWLAASLSGEGPGDGIGGNGRAEATVDVATRMPGRIEEIFVREGDFVRRPGNADADRLPAGSRPGRAVLRQAEHGVAAQAQVALRKATWPPRAMIGQREAELDAARRRLARSEALAERGATSAQQLDDDRAQVRAVQAAVTGSRAQATAAEAAVTAARAQVVGAQSQVEAAAATVARIEADLADATLRAPRDGRVQVRVAQPGEVLAAGGRVLNLLDLSDVYMTFFVPETVAGRIALGAEVRIVLDAAPDIVVPASVSFIASQAHHPAHGGDPQRAAETDVPVRAQIPPHLPRQHLSRSRPVFPAWPG